MATTKKKTTKKVAKPSPTKRSVVEGPRRVKVPKRRPFKRQDKRFRQRRRLPNVIVLTKKAWHLQLDNWRIIGGLMLVYGVLNIVLVRGLNGGVDVSSLKSQLHLLVHGVSGNIATGFAIFGQLLTSSSNPATAQASSYQTLLLIMVSLAVVWSYRQLLAGHRIRIRDGFYQGMQPFVPVLLVLLVVLVQFLPLIIGIWLYTALVSGGIVINAFQQIGAGLLAFGLACLSIYWLCSSLFALYIAALPGMTPMRALRSSRELVRYRRWPLLRKLVFLPLLLLIVGALIMLPFILFAALIAQWVFFVLSTLALAAVHAYLYTLYRELIND